MMEESRLCHWSVIRSILAIVQWWGFNVTVIIMNKWIFQVELRFFSCDYCFGNSEKFELWHVGGKPLFEFDQVYHLLAISIGFFTDMSIIQRMGSRCERDFSIFKWGRSLHFYFFLPRSCGEDSLVHFKSGPVEFTYGNMKNFFGTIFLSEYGIFLWTLYSRVQHFLRLIYFIKLDFKFPLSVSSIHFICSAIGAYLVIKVLKLKPLIPVNPEDRWRRIFPMSFVFCINIVLGNVSLRYIPVSFMQTIKSFTPATTVFLQWLVWRKYFDSRIWASLIPIVGGILLTSITEVSFNMFGFCAALFGCLATSTKTILAESLLHGYKFDSINTVYYMAPFATMILAVPALLLEGSGVIEWFHTCPSLFSSLIIIFGSGVLAFCLNFSIFYVIHSTTAVTFNVAGNLKVAVAVTCSWLIFRNPISYLNAIGCAITLVGCTFYGYVRHKLSQQSPGTPLSPRTPSGKMELIPLVNEKLDDKV